MNFPESLKPNSSNINVDYVFNY